MKVHILPEKQHAPYGILRVIEAMHAHLPDCGIELVDDPRQADVLNLHAMTWAAVPGVPIVHSSHGLYWGEFAWPPDHLEANARMIGVMKRSQAVTAPSHWVAKAISRGILRKPHVIHHGVDPDLWQPGENRGYVLWNKARADIVSNPEEMQNLAAMLDDVAFVSTLGDPADNVTITGTVEQPVMRQMVADAGVYLATARETFGIGTLEAMACGVPVVGWDHGGQREIVTHGETGFLVPRGNYELLGEAVRQALAHRQRLGANARQDVLDRWLWSDKIAQYADVFRGVITEYPIKVSVIVTAHNLGRFLRDCLQSVARQTLGDWECLIVDDSSDDDTPQIAAEFSERDGRFRYLRTPVNLKLSGARNYGFSHAVGEYVIFLDADDMLSANALELLATPMDGDPGIHIAYGHLDVISEDGGNRRRNDWPDQSFSWLGLMAHINQLPYCALMRRDVMSLSGGYRDRDWRAEDASLWCRVTSLGFEAQKVTEQSTLIYRIRSDSKSVTERNAGHSDGDWTSWLPWGLGAATAKIGAKMLAEGKQPDAALVPFAAQGAPPFGGCWPVWSHHDPLISVIIPVGPGHEQYVIDALDSVQAQTFPFWEAIVVNDTGKPLDLKFAPWATLVENRTHNIADSRNAGIAAATAPLVLFLDADDFLLPGTLATMLKAYIDHGGSRYIYTDWWAVEGESFKQQASRDYVRDGTGLHPITVLIDKSRAIHVGGFDWELPGWEDWDFFIKLAIAGFCGQRVDQPLLVYRTFSGRRREQSLKDAYETLPILRERYDRFFADNRTEIMPACCGGDSGAPILEAKRRYNMLERPIAAPQVSDGMVRIKFAGRQTGTITLTSVGGQKLSRAYRLGNNAHARYADATPEDAEALVNAGLCAYVKPVVGVDLSQAVVPKPDIIAGQPPAQPEQPASQPDYMKPAATSEEMPEITPRTPKTPAELAEIQKLTLAKFREALIGMGTDELESLESLERSASKPRVGALRAIKLLKTDLERIDTPA